MPHDTYITGWLLHEEPLSDSSIVHNVVGKTIAGTTVTINCADRATADAALQLLNGIAVVGVTVDATSRSR